MLFIFVILLSSSLLVTYCAVLLEDYGSILFVHAIMALKCIILDQRYLHLYNFIIYIMLFCGLNVKTIIVQKPKFRYAVLEEMPLTMHHYNGHSYNH